MPYPTPERYGDRSFFLHYHFPKRGKHSKANKGSGALNDSIWATVLGVAKTFGMTDKQALYDISYKNAIMYSKAMPMPDDENDDSSPEFDAGLDANDPNNFNKFNDFNDEEVVRI